MLLSPHPQETASLFRTDLEYLQSTCTRHGVPFGTPPDLIAFPRALSLNQGLADDLTEHVTAIQRRGAGRLSLPEIITILILSLGGPTVLPLEEAGVPVEEATEALSTFLLGLGGWTRADLGLSARSAPRTELPDPIQLDDRPEINRPYLVPRDEGETQEAASAEIGVPPEPRNSSALTSAAESTPVHLPEPHPAKTPPVLPENPVQDELSDVELQAKLHEETPEPDPPASAVDELNQVLSRLELTSLQLKHHLDSIDQRISRMEPRLESMPALLPSSPNSLPVAASTATSSPAGPGEPPKAPPSGVRFASPVPLDRSRSALPAKPDLSASAVSAAGTAKWPKPIEAAAEVRSAPVQTLTPTATPIPESTPTPATTPTPTTTRIPIPIPIPKLGSAPTPASPAAAPAQPDPDRNTPPAPRPVQSPNAEAEDRRRLLRSFETPARRPGFNRRRQKIALSAIVFVTLLCFGGAILYLLDPDLSHGITIGSYTFGAENPYRSRGASLPKPAAPPPGKASTAVPAPKSAPAGAPAPTVPSTPSTTAPSTMVLDSPVPHVNVYSAHAPKPGSLLTTSDSSSGRVNVPSAIMASNLDSARLPIYPPSAAKMRLQGVVVLQTLIASDGSVQSVTPLGGPVPLRAAAIEAVRKWRYRPYFVDGHAVEVSTVVSVDFNLNPK